MNGETGAAVPPFYDSLLAKIIVHGEDRNSAVSGMSNALANCKIEGVATNLAMHAMIMNDEEFRKGGVDTRYFPRFLQHMHTPEEVPLHIGGKGSHG